MAFCWRLSSAICLLMSLRSGPASAFSRACSASQESRVRLFRRRVADFLREHANLCPHAVDAVVDVVELVAELLNHHGHLLLEIGDLLVLLNLRENDAWDRRYPLFDALKPLRRQLILEELYVVDLLDVPCQVVPDEGAADQLRRHDDQQAADVPGIQSCFFDNEGHVTQSICADIHFVYLPTAHLIYPGGCSNAYFVQPYLCARA
jgi:hypothetical protein